MASRKRAAAAEEDDDEVVLSEGDDDEPPGQRQRLAPDYPKGAVLKLLGRAKEVKEYVKRGESSATVTITLSSGNPAKPVVVTRKLSSDNRSEWTLNGAVSTQTKVAEAVAALNVQLDNLCQFLPQDRVVAFAQMSSCQLLVETEKAFGARELHEAHDALKAGKQAMKDLESEVAASTAALERLQAQNAGMERDVERFQKREETLAKVEAMKAKLPWLLYEAARTEQHSKKAELAAAKTAVETAQAALEAATAPLTNKKKALATAAAAAKQDTKQAKAASEEYEKMAVEADDAHNKVLALTAEITNLSKAAAAREAKVAKLTAAVEASKAALAELLRSAEPDAAARKQQLAELRARIKADSAEVSRAEDVCASAEDRLRVPRAVEMNARGKLSSLDDMRTQRLGLLGGNVAAAAATAERLLAAGRLSGRIYGPLLCEVAVKDKQSAAWLEQQCPKHVWSFFVTQSEADRDLFHKETEALRVSIVHYTGDPEADPPPVVSPELDALGVTGVLDSAFDAPPVVKAVLRDEGGTGRAYMSGTAGETNADAIMQLDVPILWTPTMQYVLTKSRHSATARSIRVVPLREPRFFRGNTNPAERAQHEAAIAGARREIAAILKEQKVAEEKRDELVGAVDGLRRQVDQLTKAEAGAERKRRSAEQTVAASVALLKTEVNGPNPTVELPRTEARRAKATKTAAEKAVKAAQLLVGLSSALMLMAAPTLTAAELEVQVKVLEAQTDSQSDAVKAAKAEHAKAEAAKKAAHAHAKGLYDKAQAVMPVDEVQEAEEKFGGGWPESIDEMEELIAATAAEADAILCPNPGVMAEYKARSADIVTQTKTLAAKSAELAGHQAKLDDIKADWLPKLRALFAKVNIAFTEAFRTIGCVGEVVLEEHGDNFDAYAVNIMVKFRAGEQLTKLTAQRQSGGERSVATMLYLIALQDLTRCPFRVVDEINQGMDPTNERKIFAQMVASACAPGTPQCFLLTPKLLPQLEYQKEVTVLCIFNGPWQADVSRNWNKALLLDGCDE